VTDDAAGTGSSGPTPTDASRPGSPPDAPSGPHPDTVAITSGRASNHGSLAPVLWQSTVFASDSVRASRVAATNPHEKRFYSRNGNPTVAAFEDAVAALEGAEAARAFASGMGAVSAAILCFCSPGDHLVTQYQLYGGTLAFLEQVCSRFGIDVTYVDGTEPGAFAAAVQPGRTTLVFAETPANPCLDIVDLDELGAIAGPITIVDSTFATPALQRPLDHGVDLVLHSATKGMAGHNDATLGVIAGSAELIDWLWGFAVLHGASASPADALNALRGLRTLPVRIERQCATASTLAAALEAHPAVANVRHPSLASHPGHDLAARQMSGPGSLLSFEIAAGEEAAVRCIEALRLIHIATSLGGPETLVTHPVSTTHAHSGPEDRLRMGITGGTVRLSVGLEHPDDLLADLRQALDASGT
jgi:cystathionine beta-lyase/cystathionine gamma-synthase